MKRLALLVLASLFLQGLIAQSSKKQYMGLSIGPSFPLSDFAKSDINDSTSGFAKTGVALDFTYAYRVSHNFGIQFVVNYSGNKLDNQKYEQELHKANPDFAVQVESNQNWSSGGLFGGPYLRFPIGDFSVDIRGLIGYYGSYSPQATIYATKIDNASQKSTYTRQSSRDFGFGYLLGAGLKYRVSNYYVTVFADYIGADLNFDNAVGLDWNQEPYTTSFSQKINYLSVSVGLAYIL
jgi:hypothetical protein